MDINKFVDEYIKFLKENLNVNVLGDYQEITLPFYDRNNDSLVVYIEKRNHEFVISDDSYILNDLLDSGFILSPKRKRTLEIICAKLGVKLEDKELKIICKENELIKKVHTLAQAMLRIDDMYLTSQTRVTSYFIEDLMNFFDKNEIYYSRDISFIGKTGMTHSFDFLFQRSKNNPERVCRAINNATKNNMINVLFAWQDIEMIRANTTNLIVIINDDNTIEKDVLNGFENYDIKSYLWSEISAHIDAFS